MLGNPTNRKISFKVICYGIIVLLLTMSGQDFANLSTTHTDWQQSLLQSTISPFSSGAQVAKFSPHSCSLLDSVSCSGLWSCLDLICNSAEKGSYNVIYPNVIYSCDEISEENLIERLDKNYQSEYRYIKNIEMYCLYLLYSHIGCLIVMLTTLVINFEIRLVNFSCSKLILLLSILVYASSKFMYFTYAFKVYDYINQSAIYNDDQPPKFITNSSNYSRHLSIKTAMIQSIFLFITYFILYLRLHYPKWRNSETLSIN
jgi:hypothetical protein